MSVRLVKRRYPGKDTDYECWMIDVLFEHLDGRKERVRKASPVQTRRGAEKYERDVLQALAAGTYGKKEEVTKVEVPKFAAFAREFQETYVVTNNKNSEAQSKEMILRVHLTPFFGASRLDEIGTLQVERYKAQKLQAKLAPKTVNNHLTVLRKLLAVAVEWERLGHVPLIKWLRVPEPEFDFLTFEEAERLNAAADPEWRPMITTGLKVGLRQGEILALRWDDVDLVAGRIVVRRAVSRGVIGTPKNGKTREVALGEQILRALKGHRHLRGELVFSSEGGNLLTKGECKWPLWRACKRAGLRRIGWHVLRHTFASHLVMRGAPLKAVQELLGHATIEMTMRYAHLSPDARRDAVRLLDGANGHGSTVAANPSREQN